MLFAATVLLLLFQAPAWAHHKKGNEGGPSQQSSHQDGKSWDENKDEGAASEAVSSSEGSASEQRSPLKKSGPPGDGTHQESHSNEGSGGTSKASTSSINTSTASSNTHGGQGCDGSHGSDKGHGANTDGPNNPYHNTCDGSPSLNGNGNGNATGTPCAGCVGNADD
jgi:hypothetical protein